MGPERESALNLERTEARERLRLAREREMREREEKRELAAERARERKRAAQVDAMRLGPDEPGTEDGGATGHDA